jgi:hypothetical protein
MLPMHVALYEQTWPQGMHLALLICESATGAWRRLGVDQGESTLGSVIECF